jgi:transcriptional regulator with GAF, ATPase, and Fis domain
MKMLFPIESESAFAGIIGTSAALQKVFELTRLVGPHETSVLISGESGTGKEAIAAAIHKLSPRHRQPFVKVDCAAIPIHLVESELFGHERGAFTDAVERRIGKFERAQGGTLFLDEIGELPLDSQTRLLRVLQEREIERVGGNKPIAVNVRVIAATNRNLPSMIAKGDFRSDLYYRLNVFPIEMPPLRVRQEDIPLLLSHFIDRFAQQTGKRVTSIQPRLVDKLIAHSWPGNVRELQNVIERAVAVARSAVIADIFLLQSFSPPEPSYPSLPTRTIQEAERDLILSVLQKCNYRVSGQGGAAEFLQLPPSTVYYRLLKLGIHKKH